MIKVTHVYYETLWRLNENSHFNQNYIINCVSETHKQMAFPVFTLTAVDESRIAAAIIHVVTGCTMEGKMETFFPETSDKREAKCILS